MTEETKPTGVVSEQPKASEATPEKTIPVDVYGISVDLPLSKAKELITKRDSKTKEYNELKGKIEVAETKAKQEAERASLLELMKKGEAEAVEAQVSAKYRDTISRFEQKVYRGEVKSQLAKAGVIAEALEDAAKLVLSDASPTLDGDEVKLGGKKVDEFIGEWVKNKTHLLAVQGKTDTKKKNIGRTEVTPVKPEKNSSESLKNGITKFLK